MPTTTRKPSKASGRTTSRRAKRPATERRATRGFYVIKWIEAHCVHTKGEWIGKPFRLLAWQKRLILELFELRPDGRRRYRWALVGVPKKNGKTELAAALGLFFLIADGEPAPLVVCAAASDGQADLVFGAAKTMCEQSPTLKHITETFEKQILVPSIPGAVLQRVAAIAGTNDGPSIHVVICDELHEWTGSKGESVWNVLTNGFGARKQPLALQITTAGFDRDTICYRQYDYGKRVAAGKVDDARYYFHWVEAPEGSDHRDPAVWAAANPSYGDIIEPEFFEDQVSKKLENTFRRYFLNQWTESSEAWLPAGTWAACRGDAQIPPGSRVVIGVDLGLKRDSTAVAAVAQLPDGRIAAEAVTFDPPGDGTTLDVVELEAYLLDLVRSRTVDHGWLIETIAYDSWSFEAIAQRLSDQGLPMTEFPQNNENMCPASQRLYEAVMGGRIVHDGDPVLASHVAAGVTTETERGWRLTKRKATQKIDALIAVTIAFAVLDRNESHSVYESRGLLSI